MTRRILTIVLGAFVLTVMFCGQILAEDTSSNNATSRAARTPEVPLTTAPESTPPVSFVDLSADRSSGPQVKTIGGLRTRGPERAKVTIVGRPYQRARIVGEDGQVEWLERRPMLPSPSVAPSVRQTRHSNQYEQARKRQALRKRLDIQPSARPTIASDTTRPRIAPTPPPARRRGPKSPQRPAAPVRDSAEH